MNKELYKIKKPTGNEYDSEFCTVTYIRDDNVVLLTWKKFCCFDDYRNPTMYGCKLLGQYPSSNLIVDARNGFEDEKEDVQWGFSVLLPAIFQTGCKKVCFIINEINDIEHEMDLWTAEFIKYFAVTKVTTYNDAVRFIKTK